jgi:hypothetical protein
MKKRCIYTLFVLPLAALLLSACEIDAITGSGHVATDKRAVSGFDRVELTITGDLIITQGDEESLEIEAEDNLLDYIDTTVHGDTLVIGRKEERLIQLFQPTRPIRYHLIMKDIHGVAVSGSGSASAERIETDDLGIDISGSGDIIIDTLKAGALTLDISGSGDVTMHDVTADKIDANIGGAGTCKLSGKVSDQKVVVKGTGDYKAADMESQTADIRVTGSGSSHVWVTESLTVNISGSGDTVYTGDAKLSMKVTGSGEVKHADSAHGG